MQSLLLEGLDISSLVVEFNVKNKAITINPGVYCLFDEKAPTNSYHMHNCYELCVVTKGKGMYTYNDQIHPIEKGDLFLADPKVFHEIAISLNKKVPLGVFYFSFEILGVNEIEPVYGKESVVDRFLRGHEYLAKNQTQLFLLLEFLMQYSKHPQQHQSTIKKSIEMIILEALECLSVKSIGCSRLGEDVSLSIIDETLNYISQHLTEKITIDDIADYTNTSSRNLQKLFKRALKVTIKEYIDSRRVQFASSYLKMNFKVSDVAYKIGMDDTSQFCRFFKKHMGMTPKQYQLKYMADGMKYGALFEDIT